MVVRRAGVEEGMVLTRRLILLVAATLVPLVGIMALDALDLRQAREEEVRRSVMVRAQRMAGELAQVVESVRSVLETLAQIAELKREDPDACSRLLRSVRALHESFVALGATRADGSLLCVDRDGADQLSGIAVRAAADRDYFRKAAASRRFGVGTYAFGRLTRKHVVHFAAPYHDRSGTFAGVLFAAYSLSGLARTISTGRSGARTRRSRSSIPKARSSSGCRTSPGSSARCFRLPCGRWRRGRVRRAISR